MNEPTIDIPTKLDRIVFEVMDKTGDTKHIWDPGNADEVEAARGT